jgi:hypothetical protein
MFHFDNSFTWFFPLTLVSPFFFNLSSIFGEIFKTNFRGMAYNVPAVYDVFAVAIKERKAFQQPQKCGGEKPHKGR